MIATPTIPVAITPIPFVFPGKRQLLFPRVPVKMDAWEPDAMDDADLDDLDASRDAERSAG